MALEKCTRTGVRLSHPNGAERRRWQNGHALLSKDYIASLSSRRSFRNNFLKQIYKLFLHYGSNTHSLLKSQQKYKVSQSLQR